MLQFIFHTNAVILNIIFINESWKRYILFSITAFNITISNTLSDCVTLKTKFAITEI